MLGYSRRRQLRPELTWLGQTGPYSRIQGGLPGGRRRPAGRMMPHLSGKTNLILVGSSLSVKCTAIIAKDLSALENDLDDITHWLNKSNLFSVDVSVADTQSAFNALSAVLERSELAREDEVQTDDENKASGDAELGAKVNEETVRLGDEGTCETEIKAKSEAAIDDKKIPNAGPVKPENNVGHGPRLQVHNPLAGRKRRSTENLGREKRSRDGNVG